MINYKLEKKIEEIVTDSLGGAVDMNPTTGEYWYQVDKWKLQNDISVFITDTLEKYRDVADDTLLFEENPTVEEFLNKTLK